MRGSNSWFMGLTAVAVLSLSVGCERIDERHPSVVSSNQKTLSDKGDEVGTLPDGRKIVRYRLEMGRNGLHVYNPHWVYVVDNVVTLNYEAQQGKAVFNETEVIINGVTYKPVER